MATVDLIKAAAPMPKAAATSSMPKNHQKALTPCCHSVR